MNVSDAVRQRHSVRAFKPEQPPAAMVRSILEQAARAPSGGNLQPWHVHALAGEPLAQLLHLVATAPMQEEPEYAVYPPELWESYRTRRWRNAEQLYTAIGIPREERVARLMRLAGLRGVSQRRGFFVTTWRDPGLGEKAHATCAFFEVSGVEIGYCKATDQQTVTRLWTRDSADRMLLK